MLDFVGVESFGSSRGVCPRDESLSYWGLRISRRHYVLRCGDVC